MSLLHPVESADLAREKRGKARGCRDFWLAQPDVDSDLADSLWKLDLNLLRAARKEGRGHMKLHVGPPGDMTEGSLAGLRDEPLLSPSPTPAVLDFENCVGAGTVVLVRNVHTVCSVRGILHRSVFRT